MTPDEELLLLRGSVRQLRCACAAQRRIIERMAVLLAKAKLTITPEDVDDDSESDQG